MTNITVNEKMLADIARIAAYNKWSENAVLPNLIKFELSREHIEPTDTDVRSPVQVSKNCEAWAGYEILKGKFSGKNIDEADLTFQNCFQEILKIYSEKSKLKEDNLYHQLKALGVTAVFRYEEKVKRGKTKGDFHSKIEELGISVGSLSGEALRKNILRIAKEYRIPFHFKLKKKGNSENEHKIFASDNYKD